MRKRDPYLADKEDLIVSMIVMGLKRQDIVNALGSSLARVADIAKKHSRVIEDARLEAGRIALLEMAKVARVSEAFENPEIGREG